MSIKLLRNAFKNRNKKSLIIVGACSVFVVVIIFMILQSTQAAPSNKVPTQSTGARDTKHETAAAGNKEADQEVKLVSVAGVDSNAPSKPPEYSPTGSSSNERPSSPVSNSKPPVPAPMPSPAPSPSPLHVTNITVATTSSACVYGSLYIGYSYSFDFNYPNSGGSFMPVWEYEMLEVPANATEPNMPVLPVFNLAPNIVKQSDTVQPYNYGFPGFMRAAYRARIHVSSPSNVYSNWITIPRDYSNGC